MEVVTAALRRIDAVDGELRAFITVMRDSALQSARTAEKEIAAGHYRGPLHGVPIALKDVIDTAGTRTTHGSRIFRDAIPQTDAGVVARLKDAGAVIIGKNNLHEFAMGSTTANPFFGACRNPWNPDHVPGGSSGGSAAAVAARLCFGALASDTAGSIRSPASQCGVFGLKPTAGLVSRAGVLPVSPTLDHVGPVARTATDIALMLGAVCEPAADYAAAMQRGVGGLKVGVPTSYFFEAIDEEVEGRVREAIDVLAAIGAQVVPVEWPEAAETAEVVFTIAAYEAVELHRAWLGSRSAEYSDELRARLEGAAKVSPSHYNESKAKVEGLRKRFVEVMKTVDLIATPTNPIYAPRRGHTHVTIGGRRLPIGVVMPRLGAPHNLTGCPALSVPCGFAGDGLPVGLQLIGRPFDEATILGVARAFDEATDIPKRTHYEPATKPH